MTAALDQLMSLAPVIPVLVIEEEAHAVPLARALAAGGLRALEVTLRTSADLAAIRAIAREVPEATVGAGSVLDGQGVAAALDAGARFIVSPGLSEAVVEASAQARLPLLAGVATASEVMRGLDLGLTRFNVFPAEALGGAAMVEAFEGPFPDCRFRPTGGVGLEQAPAYLALPNVGCVGASWVAPKDKVRIGDWAAIEVLARAAASLRPR